MKNINTILTTLFEEGKISLEVFKLLCDNRAVISEIIARYNSK